MNAADTAALACLPLNVHCCHIRWKASQQAGAEGSLSDLTLKDKHGQVIEKQLPGGKVKKKAKNEIILETNTRSRKKCVTTILGMHPERSQLPNVEPIPSGYCLAITYAFLGMLSRDLLLYQSWTADCCTSKMLHCLHNAGICMC